MFPFRRIGTMAERRTGAMESRESALILVTATKQPASARASRKKV
jgi:hypothetical protein